MLTGITVIQGGMGAGVSLWWLARAVSWYKGCMGTISGIALCRILAWNLQHGDPGGHYRRALRAFPIPEIAQRVYRDWFREPGSDRPCKPFPKPSLNPSQDWIDLALVGNFVQVYLAKEGRGENHPININYLEKIQFILPTSIVGAMLAGVDCVSIGAGIPKQIPGMLDAIAKGKPAIYQVNLGTSDKPFVMRFDPRKYMGKSMKGTKRPKFIAIVASDTLVRHLERNTDGVDGFVIEGPTAGGHNAPPRGHEKGQPFVYVEKDKPDLEVVRGFGKPFWLAGGQCSPEALRDAQAAGAKGIQVGSAFALCPDSNLLDNLKQTVLRKATEGTHRVGPRDVSPTFFPFRVSEIEGTLSDENVYQGHKRRCALGFLRSHRRKGGRIISLCPAEPISAYIRKGGSADDTVGRICLCDALMSAIGQQYTNEPAVVTFGDGNFARDLRLIRNKDGSLSVRNVIRYIRSKQLSYPRCL